MNIEQFTLMINHHAGIRAIRRYITDVPDYRFGIPETYVAATFEQNGTSTTFEFRVGFTNTLINNFNQHNGQGVEAKNHDTNQDMLVVRIPNNAFSDKLIALIDKCAERAVRKYFEAH
jgi:hypothetical protein